ncbi:MAG: TonB-dependent receptor [Rhodobacteraceae bacterium]|nr:MAG: TonB-dependent receptor [Paracoccaceae bacterium]
MVATTPSAEGRVLSNGLARPVGKGPGHMKHILGTASAAALILGGGAAGAQGFDLGEIVIFANQTETEAFRVGVTVETLDADDIESGPASGVAETLDRLPGISVNANGGPGKSASLFVRGLPDRYTAVRLNGIDITDPSSVQTQYNWGGLSGAGLDRIEVLKGSQSALYGSEAIAGVINMTTFRPTENGMSYRFGVEIGSFDTLRTDVSVGYRSDTAMLALTLSQVDTDAFSAADENQGNTETDPFKGRLALLSGRFAVSDIVTLGFDAIYEEQETNIDAGGGVGGDADRPFFTDRKGARVYAEIETGTVSHEIGLSRFETTRQDPLTPFGSPRFDSSRTEADWIATTTAPLGPLAFGLAWTEEEATFSNGTFAYRTASAFAEYQMALGEDVDLTLSGRYDDNSRFGGALTGRAALAWRPAEGTVVRASLGTGFRAPSLNELFGPFNTLVPNPALEPEESRSAELGIEHRYSGGAFVKATVFYTEIDNLIGFVSGPPPLFLGGYTQTPGTSTAKGLELSGELPLGQGFSLIGAYTLTDSRLATGERQPRVPRHDLLLGIAAEMGNGWAGQVLVNHVADRIDGFPAAPVPDYTVATLQISYDVTEAATAYLRIENLFDEEYQTAAGFGTSDRAVYFGIRANF